MATDSSLPIPYKDLFTVRRYEQVYEVIRRVLNLDPHIVYAHTQPGNTWDAKVASAISKLPTEGGIVDARGLGGAQKLAANVNINRSRCIVLMGPMNLTMGSFQLLVTAGVNSVGYVGMGIPFGGFAAGVGATYLNYTGTAAAIAIGSSSATTEQVVLSGMGINTASAGTASIAIGLYRTITFNMEDLRLSLPTTSITTQTGLLFDGTGGYTGNGGFRNVRIDNGKYCIRLTGNGVNAANAITGSQFILAGVVASTIGISVEQQSNGNTFTGFDIENMLQGINDSYGYNQYIGRVEGNTTDLVIGASAVGINASFTNGTVTVTDSSSATSNNIVKTPNGYVGHWRWKTDNTYDVGSSSTGRPRVGYFGTAIDVADTSGATSFIRSGQAVIGDTTISATSLNLIIKSEAGKNRHLSWFTGSTARWMLRANSAAESGSDVGSDFQMWRYTDAGSANQLMEWKRSTGSVWCVSPYFGIGTTSHLIDRILYVTGTPSDSATTQYGCIEDYRIPPAATTLGIGHYVKQGTVAAPFTVTTLEVMRLANPVKGASSTITNAVGLNIESVTTGTNNWAIMTGTGLHQFGDKVKLNSTGGLVTANAALSTSATTGFTYIPTCAGTPTGTPTAETGTCAMVYDTTNNKLYVYNGAWKSVTLA